MHRRTCITNIKLFRGEKLCLREDSIGWEGDEGLPVAMVLRCAIIFQIDI